MPGSKLFPPRKGRRFTKNHVGALDRVTNPRLYSRSVIGQLAVSSGPLGPEEATQGWLRDNLPSVTAGHGPGEYRVEQDPYGRYWLIQYLRKTEQERIEEGKQIMARTELLEQQKLLRLDNLSQQSTMLAQKWQADSALSALARAYPQRSGAAQQGLSPAGLGQTNAYVSDGVNRHSLSPNTRISRKKSRRSRYVRYKVMGYALLTGASPFKVYRNMLQEQKQ